MVDLKTKQLKALEKTLASMKQEYENRVPSHEWYWSGCPLCQEFVVKYPVGSFKYCRKECPFQQYKHRGYDSMEGCCQIAEEVELYHNASISELASAIYQIILYCKE